MGSLVTTFSTVSSAYTIYDLKNSAGEVIRVYKMECPSTKEKVNAVCQSLFIVAHVGKYTAFKLSKNSNILLISQIAVGVTDLSRTVSMIIVKNAKSTFPDALDVFGVSFYHLGVCGKVVKLKHLGTVINNRKLGIIVIKACLNPIQAVLDVSTFVQDKISDISRLIDKEDKMEANPSLSSGAVTATIGFLTHPMTKNVLQGASLVSRMDVFGAYRFIQKLTKT